MPAPPHTPPDDTDRPRTGWGGAWAAGWRLECGRIRRSRWDLALLTLAPLLTLLLLGALFLQSTPRELPVAVVDADHSAESRLLRRHLAASAQVRLVAEPESLAAAWALARRGEVWAVLHIPAGTAQALHRGDPAPAVLYRNAAFYSVGALAGRGVAAAVAAANRELLPALARQHNLPGLRLELPRVQSTVLFNPQLSYEWFLEALLQPGVLHLLMSALVVMAVCRGAAPGGPLALAGQLAPYVLAFTLWQWAGTAWLCGWRGWGVHGSLPLLLLGQLLLYACYAAIAALVGLLLRDGYTALSAVALYGGPAMTFSDATLPVAGGPLFTQVWSALLPFSAYVKLQMAQMFMATPTADSLRWIVLLAGVGAGAFVLAAVIAARRARQAAPAGTEADALDGVIDTNAGPAGVLQRFADGLIGTWRAVLRVRPALLILVGAGLLYGFYYPLAYQHEVATKLPLAVVDLDGGPLADRLVSRLAAAPQLALQHRGGSLTEAQALLARREVDAFVVIPRGFERGMLTGAQPDAIAFYLNGAYLVRASAVGVGLQAMLQDAAADLARAPAQALGLRTLQPLQLQEHALFNTREGYGSYVVPGVAVVIVHQTLLIGIGLLVAERRRRGLACGSAAELLGSGAAYAALGTLTALLFFGFVFWFQDYPRAGPPAAMVAATLLFVGATVAFGLCIGSAFDRGERSPQLLAASSAPVFFLSGLPWPFSAMPPALATLAQLLPSTAGVQALVKVNQMGADLPDLRPELTMLLGLLVAYGVIAGWRLRGRGPDSPVKARFELGESK